MSSAGLGEIVEIVCVCVCFKYVLMAGTQADCFPLGGES